MTEQDHLTDYIAVATDWHRRGFFTTPVKPGAKHPRLNEWNTRPAKNLSVAMQHAYDYPHDDVGLVSRRGIGNKVWIDIDHPSFEDAIYRETGNRLPHTLTTLSRPLTAPYKKHLCFRQTAHSFSTWRTEMTGIRDFSMPAGSDGKIPNLFDVKGCGGGGFVVAGGCWRQTMTPAGIVYEQYTSDDAPVVDVPEWLVKWVLARYQKFRAEDAVRRAAEADLARTIKAALTKAETERRVVAFEYDKAKDALSIDAKGGALVPKEYRNGFLKSLAGELATRGIPRNQTEQMLQVAAQLCEPHANDDERDKEIQRIVNRLRIGNVWIGRTFLREDETSSHESSHDKSGERLGVLRQAAKGLPWNLGELPSHLVNERLRQAAVDAGCSIGKPENWRKAVSTALGAIGAKVRNVSDGRGKLVKVWSLPSSPIVVDTGSSTTNVVNSHENLKDLAARAEEGSCRTN